MMDSLFSLVGSGNFCAILSYIINPQRRFISINSQANLAFMFPLNQNINPPIRMIFILNNIFQHFFFAL